MRVLLISTLALAVLLGGCAGVDLTPCIAALGTNGIASAEKVKELGDKPDPLEVAKIIEKSGAFPAVAAACSPVLQAAGANVRAKVKELKEKAEEKAKSSAPEKP